MELGVERFGHKMRETGHAPSLRSSSPRRLARMLDSNFHKDSISVGFGEEGEEAIVVRRKAMSWDRPLGKRCCAPTLSSQP